MPGWALLGAHLRIFLLITALSVAVYANSFYNSFHFDDQHYIVTNPYIRDLSNIPTFFKSSQYSSFEKMFTGHYRPLLVTSYALNYAISDLNPVGYHLVNLGFHTGSAFLVFLILEAMLGSSGLPATFTALAVAFIFAVHPFNSEVVNYITARSSVMCSFFYLLSFYCWILFRNVAAGFSLRPMSTPYYLASLLAFLLAMLTKEIAITLPVMLVLYDMYFYRSTPKSATRRCYHLSYLPYILLGAVPYLIYRFRVYGGIGLSGGTRDFYTNLLTQSKVLLKYMQLMILPLGLSIEHDIATSNSIYDVSLIISIVALLFIVTTAYLLFKRGGEWKVLSFFLLWFFITLLPTTLLPLNAILQENRGYLAGIGFPLFAGICVGKLPRQASTPLLLILISLLSIMTIQRNRVWKDDYALWRDAANKSPNSARVHDNLGLAYIGRGEYDLAIAEFQRTLELHPLYYLAYYNAGVVYQLQNSLDLARDSYEECLKINPQYFRAYYNLGILYRKTGDLDKAIQAYEKAISLDQRHSFVYNNLGVALTDRGQTDKAESVFKKAVELDPGYEKAYFNLGNLYYKAGKYGLAAGAYRSSLKIKPDYKEAREMLKAALNPPIPPLLKGGKGGLQ